MAICPYCQREMKKGFLVADGRNTLIWEEDRKRSIRAKLTNEDCIILGCTKFFQSIRVKSNYCPECKRIIIENAIWKPEEKI